jgi:DNA mismatch repair protein MutS
MADNEKLTPLWRQYHQIKAQYPDVILLFRLGDFYEMFGEDAELAAGVLQLTLTGRDAAGERIPMCGVPYHASERYVAQLVRKGYRVAICDQVEDPRTAKGIVRREVTRIVTPGTVLDDKMLDATSNNYLAAVVPGVGAFGLALLDVSTGEFLCTEVAGEDARGALLDELQRLRPAEILLRPDCDEDMRTTLSERLKTRPEPYTRRSNHPPYQDLLRHFGTQSLRGFGCETLPSAIEAASMALDYVRLNLPDLANHIRTLSTYSTSQWMLLDPAARRNLELTEAVGERGREGSLLWVLDDTVTPMGARMLRKWLSGPLLSAEKINNRLDAVQEMMENALFRSQVREVLKGIGDLERLMGRITAGQATPRDLVGLRLSLAQVPELICALSDCSTPHVRALSARMDPLPDLYQMLMRALRDDAPLSVREGGIIAPGYSEELDNLLQSASGGREWIASLEDTERERTGIRSLKVGYNSVFGYYIEVTRPNLHLVPQEYIRKQTTANAERYITPTLKEYEALVLGAHDKSTQLEFELFTALRLGVAEHSASVRQTARAVAQLDVLASFAEIAARNRYVRPEVNEGDELLIRGGRHPVVERILQDDRFVPNDAFLGGEEDRLLVITGPNMSGKSTYLRQVGLIVLLAQCGSYVPADSARIGIVDRIFTRVGAHDDLTTGQSTFMVEMNETANILNNATSRSLVILDEIGRGTSTFDGLSIAWGVAEHLLEIDGVGVKTLFATHYHHLNELEKLHKGVRNYRIAVKEEAERIVWLRKIVRGGTDRSYGIQVARLAGLPPEVIRRAEEVLAELERSEVGVGGVDPRKAQITARKNHLQLDLFEAAPNPAVEALLKVDTSVITPVEALTELDRLQRLAREARS